MPVTGQAAALFCGVPFRIRQILLAGGVIAYPTEGVYGLGCDARVHRAVQRVIDLKARDSAKGLILIASNAHQLAPWIELPTSADARGAMLKQLTEHPNGRATTWVVPASHLCSPLLTGGRDTIAVRVTRHANAVQLCDAIDGALVSTSANLSGRTAITRPAQLQRQFRGRVDAVLARAGGGQPRPSRVIDFKTGSVLRD